MLKRSPENMNQKVISKALREFRAQDWAHRSLKDSETVSHVKRALNVRGVSVTEREIDTVVKGGLYSRFLKTGLAFVAVGLISRDITGLPTQLDWLPSIAGVGLLVIIATITARHFHRY